MKVKTLMSQVKLQFNSHKPEIFLIGGVVGLVTGTVLVCNATPKAKLIAEETKKSLDVIHEVSENDLLADEYTKTDRKKDLIKVYGNASWSLAKLYLPGILLGVASVGAICESHNIMRQRNVALVSAYTALEAGYKEYRQRVANKVGEETEKELYYGIEEIEVNEKGKKKPQKMKAKTSDVEANPYVRYFGPDNINWNSNTDYVMDFIMGVQRWCNQMLNIQGVLFLNDVYKQLDIPRTAEGQVMGWVKDPDNPQKIDFGVFRTLTRPAKNIESTRDFIEYRTEQLLLDFNVDGYVVDKLKTR